MARPVAALAAPETVAVYIVPAASDAPGGNLYVAMRPVASSDDVPAGLTHGAAHVTVKAAEPVKGAIASLNAAVTLALLVATPVAPSCGATAVTVGGDAVEGKPRIGSRPPLPPPQAARATATIAASHGRMLWYLFMFVFR